MPVDGTYITVDKDENALGRAIRLYRGEPFPQCLSHEAGYVLIETP